MKPSFSFFRICSSSIFVFSCVACGSFVPPEESTLARGNYNSCMQNVELMEFAGGSKNQAKIRQMRDFCSCSAEVMWEAEQELGWSAIEDKKTGLKLFDQCATDEMRKEKQQEINEQERKALEKQRFIDSIDSLFR